jgi:glycosyltransferase involved in cell wall biosynthesis
MKISLVILTLNEIVGLQHVFDNIPLSAVDEVFAVDGGSTDGTVEFFQQRGIPIISQQKRGRGEAFRLAFEKAQGDALIFFSPDGNEDPLDIPRFRPLLESGAGIVIANRMTGGGRNEEDDKMFPLRKWANNAFTWMANTTWNRGPYVADTINGYRGVTKAAWAALRPDGPGYTIEYQMSIRAFKHGVRIVEFPTCEAARIDERGGSPSISTGLAFLKMYASELRRPASSRTEIHAG